MRRMALSVWLPDPSRAWLRAQAHLLAERRNLGATAASAVISSVAITQAPQRGVRWSEGDSASVPRVCKSGRLVLDFSGARMAVNKTVIPSVSEPVRDVRLGQYRANVARVVVDLTSVSPYQISHDGAAVVVVFDAQPEGPSAAPSDRQTVASANETKTRAGFDYSAAIPRTNTRPSSASRIPAPRFALPGELTQPSVYLASFGGKNEPARPGEGSRGGPARSGVSRSAAEGTLAASSGQQQVRQRRISPNRKYTGED